MNDATNRGMEALERARTLEKSSKLKEALELFKEAVSCFTAALRSPTLSATHRATLTGEVQYYQSHIREIEGRLASSYLEDMPEAPQTKPIAPTKGSRARNSAPPSRPVASKADEEEEKAKMLLGTAITLEESGRKMGWPKASVGAKERAIDAYSEAAAAFIMAVKAWKSEGGGDAQKIQRSENFARQALTSAEALKGISKPTAPVTPVQPRPNPVPPRSPTQPRQGGLTVEEVGVLRDSSYVNGKLFMPWVQEDLQEKFKFAKPWTDPDGRLALSPPQMDKLQGWRRPSEVMPGQPRMIGNVNPYSIKQDLITDCSFVASLCIASAFEKRFHKQLITGIIYPQDERRIPVYNPSGKYLVKLTVNGVARKVVVDDCLPTGDKGRLLCSASADKTELWVSIIEKAYLKVNGGYDFPGSNSGIDLFALTGWLPEQIFFEENRREGSTSSRDSQPLDNYETAERVWERLLSAHEFGDCLITVATSEIEKEEADRLGLVPSHAYAVLDVKEIHGTRLLQVKNPWSRKRWRGPYSVEDSQRWTPALKQAVKYDVETAQLQDNGVFWIDFASIFTYFSNVFMNWNPGLFTCRFVLHDRWPLHIGPANDTYSVGENPQLTLVVQNGATPAAAGGAAKGAAKAVAAGGAAAAVASKASPTVWVLLSRHVTKLETDSKSGDFLAMHVYEGTQGKRVYYPDNPMFRGIYTNNPHTLIRFDLPKTKQGTEVAYTLVISQFEKKREVRYTVNVYCTSTFRLFKTPAAPEHCKQVMGAWDKDSAGGSLGSPRYFTNPQYVLVLTQPRTRVHIQAQAPKEFSVNIILASDGGMRVDTVPKEREAMSTGTYRPGFCYADGVLPAGKYTVVVSTYKAGKEGPFMMKLHTNSPVRTPMCIPAEGQGMSKQVVLGRWRQDDGSAAGCSNQGRYLENPRYLVSVGTRTSLLLRICIPETSGISPRERPAVNVTLFAAGVSSTGQEDPQSTEGGLTPPNRLALDPRCTPHSDLALASSCSGVYMNAGAGSATQLVTVDPGEYIALASAFSTQEADFVLTMYSAPAVPKLKRLP